MLLKNHFLDNFNGYMSFIERLQIFFTFNKQKYYTNKINRLVMFCSKIIEYNTISTHISYNVNND